MLELAVCVLKALRCRDLSSLKGFRADVPNTSTFGLWNKLELLLLQGCVVIGYSGFVC